MNSTIRKFISSTITSKNINLDSRGKKCNRFLQPKFHCKKKTISRLIYVYHQLQGVINTIAVTSSTWFSIYVQGLAYLLPLASQLRDLGSSCDSALDNDRLINDRWAYPGEARVSESSDSLNHDWTLTHVRRWRRLWIHETRSGVRFCMSQVMDSVILYERYCQLTEARNFDKSDCLQLQVRSSAHYGVSLVFLRRSRVSLPVFIIIDYTDHHICACLAN